MKFSRWKDTLELVGIAAIIASLIFVGQQVRQDREIAVSQNILTVVGDTKLWAELMTANSSIWIKGNSGSLLTPEEDLIYQSLVDSLEIRYVADWYRAQQVPGINPPGVFAFKYAELLKENPGLLRSWEEANVRWKRENEYVGLEDNPWMIAVNRVLGDIMEGIAPQESSTE